MHLGGYAPFIKDTCLLEQCEVLSPQSRDPASNKSHIQIPVCNSPALNVSEKWRHSLEAVRCAGKNQDTDSDKFGSNPHLLLTSCVAVGKLLNFFDLSFLVYKMGILTFTAQGGEN